MRTAVCPGSSDEGRGVPPLVHEDGAGRAPAEGLDAQLAGPGVEVQDFSSFYVELDDIEDAFLYPVGGGAGLLSAFLPTFGAGQK